MSFQLIFLGYYPIKSQQLKKQTHSVKRRNWNHRERTAPDGRPPVDGIAVHLHRTALTDGPSDCWTATPSGGRRAVSPSGYGLRRPTNGRRLPRWTSVGSSDASGHPADTDMDVRTRDNPDYVATSTMIVPTGGKDVQV
jgi:hypothetical protein